MAGESEGIVTGTSTVVIFLASPKMEVSMTGKVSSRRYGLRRWLAAAALVGIYALATIGVVVTTGVSAAQARGRGGGGGRAIGGGRGIGRGFVRGRGIGIYYGGYYDGCWWSRRRRRWVCPYY